MQAVRWRKTSFLLGIAGLLAIGFISVAGSEKPQDSIGVNLEQASITFQDVSLSNLPRGSLVGRSMDAEFHDLDLDGNLDIVVATEFGQNRLLFGDGEGGFLDGTAGRLPNAAHDSEDIAIADFDGDEDPDLLFVSEDDQVNEYYWNNGRGVFIDQGSRIPIGGITNAVLAFDIDGDGDIDIMLGNAGQNVVLANDGFGSFSNVTADHLPEHFGMTQDLELGDVDGDGDLDLIEGNEDGNRLLLNDGIGVFTDVTEDQLPIVPGVEETREADFGDIDDDGDLDIFFANVNFRGDKIPHNRILMNDGSGFYTDRTEDLIEAQQFHSVDADFVDINGDDSLDLVIANAFGGHYQIFLNTGTGRFVEATDTILPRGITGDGTDVEAADINGDGLIDLYLCNAQGGDYLLLGEIR